MAKNKKDKTKPSPIVSGTYQLVSDLEQNDLKDLENSKQLDEESMHYARMFMED